MLYFILFIISIIMYVNTPSNYSWNFCFVCMVLFFINAFFLLRKDIVKKNFISFNVIFTFSFFWVSFAYPVFIYDTPLAWFGIFSEHINWEFLSKASAVCLLFYSSYTLVYKLFRISKSNSSNLHLQSKHFRVSNNILNIIFFLFVINTFYTLISNYGHTTSVSSNPFLFDFFYAAITTYLILYTEKKHSVISFFSFAKENKKVLLFSVISILLYLYMGDRGPVIRIGLIWAVAYVLYYKSVNFLKLFLIACIGVFLMFFIRQTRETDETSFASNGLSAISKSADVIDLSEGAIYVFADLFGASHELTLECEYYDTKGAFKPERIILVPFYPFPFLPSLIGYVFLDGDPNNYNTGYELNKLMAAYNTKFGNHIVGDIYMSYGALGCIFFGGIFAYIIKLFVRRKDDNLIYRVCFIIIISLSLYIARDSIFNIIRPLALTFILLYFTLGPLKLKQR